MASSSNRTIVPRFTDEQLMLQSMVRKLANEKIAPVAAEIDRTGVYPEELVELFKRQGLMGLPFPEEYGGGGGDTLSVCLVAEELARVCTNSAIVFTNHELGAMPIVIGGNEEQKQEYLPGIAKGELRVAFALTEPDAGSDAAGMKTYARFDASRNRYVVNGTKRFISFSDVADVICLFTKTDLSKGSRGISAFIVNKPSPGLSIGKHEDKMGCRGFNSCEVIFEDLELSSKALIANEGDGFKIAMKTLDLTRPIIGAVGLGVAQGALDYAIEYSRQRIQFGRPISTFQGIQFMIADLATEVEAARQLVYWSAYLIDINSPEMTKVGAMAKAYATDVAMKVTVDAVQILGGSGYMKDYPLERKMRDAKLLQIVEGTNQIQKVVIASRLLGSK